MKITKSQLKQIIKEELEAVMDERAKLNPRGLPDSVEAEPGSPLDRMRRGDRQKKKDDEKAEKKAMRAHAEEQCKDAIDWKKCMGSLAEETERTAKGNITQDTRDKHATVGKDKFPIFDKKSAESAIKLRGHASKANQKKIINKAAKYAPEAAKKAREADKK
tara:strand:+ start:68 stop:553 length:486 start_codon:yes stop_codon:yes gene_type:complete